MWETSVSQSLFRDSTATDYSEDNRGCPTSDPAPPGYGQASPRQTVKELLALRRDFSQSKQKCTLTRQDNGMERGFGPVIPTPAPVSPTLTNHGLPSPENAHVTPQLALHPAPQALVAPAAEVKINFFIWQIQQEAARVEGVCPELLNVQDEDGDTFLHIAVAQGRRALAYVLAWKMAQTGSLNVQEHKGQTALQIAVASDHHLIAQDLLAHGAQVNTRDMWGRSPLHVCAEKGSNLSLQSIQKSLTGSGQAVDVDAYNYDGEYFKCLTPLHVAVLSHNNTVKELRALENCCPILNVELGQRSQMFVDCIKTLLLMGASCGTKDMKSGRTSLHIAAEEANVELLQLFLNRPSSLSVVNVKTFSGNAALHIVSSLQNRPAQVEAVKLLLRRGADPGARNFEKELPSHLVPVGPIGDKVRLILKGKQFRA